MVRKSSIYQHDDETLLNCKLDNSIESEQMSLVTKSKIYKNTNK